MPKANRIVESTDTASILSWGKMYDLFWKHFMESEEYGYPIEYWEKVGDDFRITLEKLFVHPRMNKRKDKLSEIDYASFANEAIQEAYKHRISGGGLLTSGEIVKKVEKIGPDGEYLISVEEAPVFRVENMPFEQWIFANSGFFSLDKKEFFTHYIKNLNREKGKLLFQIELAVRTSDDKSVLYRTYRKVLDHYRTAKSKTT